MNDNEVYPRDCTHIKCGRIWQFIVWFFPQKIILALFTVLYQKPKLKIVLFKEAAVFSSWFQENLRLPHKDFSSDR